MVGLNNLRADRMSAYSDHYNTPIIAYSLIAPFITPGSTVYDPFYNTGAAKDMIEEAFEDVVCLHEDLDAFTEKPDPSDFDVIVTNPPYSDKKRVMELLLSYKKPVFALLPLDSMFRHYMADLPIPGLVTKRGSFYFTDRKGNKFNSPFISGWWCFNVPAVPSGTFRIVG